MGKNYFRVAIAIGLILLICSYQFLDTSKYSDDYVQNRIWGSYSLGLSVTLFLVAPFLLLLGNIVEKLTHIAEAVEEIRNKARQA